MPAFLRVHYALTPGPGDDPEQAAERLAIEQTAELPRDHIPAEALAMAGRVVSVKRRDERSSDVVIELPCDAVGLSENAETIDLGQLSILLFGNASLLRGVRIQHVEWPTEWLARRGDLGLGPRFGIAGLRARVEIFDRPLTCGAAKPLGLCSVELARRVEALARGGLDLVKDDHGLADPPNARWRERVARCQESVERANAATGGRTLYVPHLAGPPSRLPERLETARALGIQAVLVAPLALGLGSVHDLATSSGLALIAHPALSGAYFAPDHGIAPAVLLGDLFRLAGCDAVVYPHEGGRFPLAAHDTAALRDHLRRPLGALAPAFPVVAGGVDPRRLAALVAELGRDTIFLLGTGLYLEPDLERAAAQARDAVRQGAEACSPRS